MGSLGDANNLFIKPKCLGWLLLCCNSNVAHKFCLVAQSLGGGGRLYRNNGMPKADTRHLYKRVQ